MCSHVERNDVPYCFTLSGCVVELEEVLKENDDITIEQFCFGQACHESLSVLSVLAEYASEVGWAAGVGGQQGFISMRGRSSFLPARVWDETHVG